MKKLMLAPLAALALAATPAMAQSAQPATTMSIQSQNPIAILIGLLLPAVQKVRDAAR